MTTKKLQLRKSRRKHSCQGKHFIEELLSLLQKSNLLQRVFEQSYQYSMQVFEFVHSEETVESFSLPLPYLLAYSVGGRHSMLLKWVEKGMSISSAELISSLKSGFAL
jgi:hypothetical protein